MKECNWWKVTFIQEKTCKLWSLELNWISSWIVNICYNTSLWGWVRDIIPADVNTHIFLGNEGELNNH